MLLLYFDAPVFFVGVQHTVDNIVTSFITLTSGRGLYRKRPTAVCRGCDRIFFKTWQKLLTKFFFSKIVGNRNNLVPVFSFYAVSYTHLRAHETVLDLVCR